MKTSVRLSDDFAGFLAQLSRTLSRLSSFLLHFLKCFRHAEMMHNRSISRRMSTCVSRTTKVESQAPETDVEVFGISGCRSFCHPDAGGTSHVVCQELRLSR